MSTRAFFQHGIDKLQYWYDVFPGLQYQPLPWVNLNKAKRGKGTKERWIAIDKNLDNYSISSAMDIGCNVGYFCFLLAEKGIPTLGIEMNDRFFRIAQYARKKINISNVALCNMTVNLDTVRLLPNVDVILLLSVWHHWVRYYGLEAATKILSCAWGKCNKIMFFETGESEMTTEFSLPNMGPTPEKWLKRYLTSACDNSRIKHLGQVKAFSPGGNETRNVVRRNLFAIIGA